MCWSPSEIPLPYRKIQETVDFEYMLARYVRLFLVNTYAAKEEGQLILKQLMIHLLREDNHDHHQPVLKTVSNQLTEVIHEIANYIRQHPGIQHRVEDLAARAGLSPRYFSIKFKDLIGSPCSVIYYKDAYRKSSTFTAICRHECHRSSRYFRVPRYLFFQ